MNENTPGLGRRLGGYLIDWYLSTMLCGGVLVFANSVETGVAAMDSSLPGGGRGLLLGTLACLLGVCYYVLFPLLWKGQTPAKRLLGMRIVSADGRAPGLGALLLRQLVGGILLEGAILFPSQLLREMVAMRGFPAVAEGLRVAAVITFLSVSMAVFVPGRRMLHDRIASTRVIAV